MSLRIEPPRRAIYMSVVVICLLPLVACGLVQDDGAPAPSGAGGDPQAPGLIVKTETIPADQAGTFTFTGVGAPQGVDIQTGGTFVLSDLEPGTYTLTEVDPAPDFDVAEVTCDDGDSEVPSAGDANTRTAVFNLEAEETVTCTFVNMQRGAVVAAAAVEPEGVGGTFQFSGVGAPQGITLPSEGTLVVSNLEPGTYSLTQFDPTPEFDLVEVSCDDQASPIPSAGDPSTRTAIFNVDAGEMVTCTFLNTRRGSLVIEPVTEPEDLDAEFTYSGVGAPQGEVVSNQETFTVDGLAPGTYSLTQFDPAPDFELTDVSCDDGDSASPSVGDSSTRTAIINIDPAETVTCTFVNTSEDHIDATTEIGGSGGTGGDGPSTGEDGPVDGINPFTDPDTHLPDFPLPDDLPPNAGTYPLPLEGPWSATNLTGSLDCGSSMTIPPSPPEAGTLTILDDGRSILAEGLDASEGAPITMTAHPEIIGYFTGTFDATQGGVPITIQYYWQLVTEEYIVGYLTSSYSAGGVSCSIYRPFELRYTG